MKKGKYISEDEREDASKWPRWICPFQKEG
jgi:hypothetical protein